MPCHTVSAPHTLSPSETSYEVQININVTDKPLGKD